MGQHWLYADLLTCLEQPTALVWMGLWSEFGADLEGAMELIWRPAAGVGG